MARDGRKSVYLEAKAVEDLKQIIDDGFTFHGLTLNNMSQVIIALVQEHREKNK